MVVTGLVGQHRLGGVAWDYLQYVAGFVEMGFDAYYLEDTGQWEWEYRRDREPRGSPQHQEGARFLQRAAGWFRLAGRWCLRDEDGTTYGMSRDELRQVLKGTELILNIGGEHWWRDEYLELDAVRALLDPEPGGMFAELAARERGPHFERATRLRALHQVFLTFGERIGRADCRVPVAGIPWIPTRQPVLLSRVPFARQAARRPFTTVLSWIPEKGRPWDSKSSKLELLIKLSRKLGRPLELALNPWGQEEPAAHLRAAGWRIVSGPKVSRTPRSYREYLASSRGELAIAKPKYVQTRSGWFSGRSALYLASGRPCILENTGFSDVLPCGFGLLAFQDADEALDAMRRVDGSYARHRRSAREVAEEFFDSRRVLRVLVERCLDDRPQRLSKPAPGAAKRPDGA